jgi:hypothetical protein
MTAAVCIVVLFQIPIKARNWISFVFQMGFPSSFATIYVRSFHYYNAKDVRTSKAEPNSSTWYLRNPSHGTVRMVAFVFGRSEYVP